MNGNITDAELLRTFIQNRCEGSFEELVVRYQGLILNVARKVLGELGDAEAVCQAVFLVLAEKAPKLLTCKCLASWLFVVARNLASKSRRSEVRRRARERKAMEEKSADPSRENAVATEVCEALAGLPNKYREPILLCYLQGIGQTEAAEQLGVSRGTLSSRLTRACRKLRKTLLKGGTVVSVAAIVSTVESYAAPATGIASGSPAALGKAAAAVQEGGIAAGTELMGKTATELAAEGIRSMLFKAIIAKLSIAIPVLTIAITALLIVPPPAPVIAGNPNPAPVGSSEPRSNLPKGAVGRLGSPPLLDDLARTLSFSADGRLLACGGWNRLFVIDVEKRAVIQKMLLSSIDKALLDHKEKGYRSDTFDQVTFSRDGKKVYATNEKHGITEWDVATGKCIRVIGRGNLPCKAIALSADGRLFIGQNQQFSVIDTSTQKVRHKVVFEEPGRALSVENIYVLGDSQTLALEIFGRKSPVGTRENPEIRFSIAYVNSRTGKLLKRVEGRRLCSVSTDGKLMVLTEKGRTWVSNAATGELLRALQGSASHENIGFIDGGKRIASHDRDGQVMVWDTLTGNLVKKLQTDKARIVAFSRGSGRFACASGKEVVFWDAEAGRLTPERGGHKSYVSSVHYDPSGKRIISGSYDYSVRIWDAETHRELRSIKPSKDEGAREISSLEISPNGKYGIARVRGVPGAVVFSLSDREPAVALEGHETRVENAIFSPDGRLIATVGRQRVINSQAYGGNLLIWDSDTRELVKTIKGVGDNITFSADSRRIFATPRGGGVQVVDIKLAKTTHTISEAPVGKQTGLLCVSPDGMLLAVASGPYHEKKVSILHAETFKILSTVDPGEGSLEDMTFSDCGNILLMALAKSILVWDVATAKLIRRINGHRDDVDSVKFSPSGKNIVSGSDDHTMLIWDAEWALHAKGAKAVDDLDTYYPKLHGDDVVATYQALSSLAVSPRAVEHAAKRLDALKNASWDDVLQLNTDPIPKSSTALQAKRLIQLLEMIGNEDAIALLKTINVQPARAAVKRFESHRWRNWSMHQKVSKFAPAVIDVALSSDCKDVALLEKDKVRITALSKLDPDRPETLGKTFKLAERGRQVAFKGNTDAFVIAGKGVYQIDRKKSTIRRLAVVDSEARHLAVSGGTLLSVVNRSNSLFLINTETGKIRRAISLPGKVKTMCFDRPGNHLALGSTRGKLAIIDCNTNKLRTLEAHGFGITSLVFSRKPGCLLSASLDLTTGQYDMGRDVFSTRSAHSSPISSLTEIDETRHLITSMDGKLALQSGANREVVWETKLTCASVKRLYYDSNSGRIYLLCRSNHLHVWGH